MGYENSGRRPQPAALRVLRGNPGKRRIPVEAQPPAVTSAFDVPPPELEGDKAAEAEWRRVAPMLRACKLVTEAERTVLLALCQEWSRYLEAHGKVRTLGMLVKTGDGIPRINPYLKICDRALVLCHRLWVELGLTPGGRAKIAALPGDTAREINKWDGLLAGVTDARQL
jgi:phage terminase, small subunit, putative, P27 family